MEKRITIAGAGMGVPDGMTASLLDEVENAELIIGAERIAAPFARLGRRVLFEYRAEAIRQIVDEAPEQRILILVTGDQGFFSASEKIAGQLADYQPRILPGISSVAYFSAVTGIPYSGAALVSAHGRELNIVSVVRRNRCTFVLAGGNLSQLLRTLCIYGYSGLEVYTGEQLSSGNERIRHGTAEDLLINAEKEPFSVLSLMLVMHPDAQERVPFGITDEAFLRGSMPMTKREVRALILSSLRLDADSVVVDIGAGTGSVTVEAALSAYNGTVYAVEKKKEALQLIKANAVRFHADNIRIVEGEAPEALRELPLADAYFIGGSGGRMGEILEVIQESFIRCETEMEPVNSDPSAGNGEMRQAGRFCSIVISAATIQTLTEAQQLLQEMRFQNISITQIQASRSRKVGRYDMLKAENPVFVITAALGEAAPKEAGLR